MTKLSMTDDIYGVLCNQAECRRAAIIHVTHEIESVEQDWNVCGDHAQELGATLIALLVRYATFAPGGSEA